MRRMNPRSPYININIVSKNFPIRYSTIHSILGFVVAGYISGRNWGPVSKTWISSNVALRRYSLPIKSTSKGREGIYSSYRNN